MIFYDLSNEEIQKDLKRKVSSRLFVNNNDNLQSFYDANIQLLKEHVPRKKIYVWSSEFLLI